MKRQSFRQNNVGARYIVPLLSIALAACAGGAATQPPAPTATASPEPFHVTVTDGLGTEVTLDARPQRIISLTLGTDEILLELVGPERLLAVTYLAATPEASNIAELPELAQVPNVVEADPEQIIALDPDLVLAATFLDPAVLEQLRGAGIPVFSVGFFTSIEAQQENILTIGELVGEPERAEEMVAEMNATLDGIAARVAGAEGERPTVLYLAPASWVAGSATTVDDIITRAGGINAASDLTDWNQLSAEAIIELDPDVVILSTYVPDEEFLTNPAFAGLRAVQTGRVVAISDAYMSATSQYIVLGVQ